MGRLRRKPGMVEALRSFPEMVQIFDEDFSGKGRWRQKFSGTGPLHVELGTGKGQFLRDMARQYPDSCFVGLEREPGVLVQAVRSAQELGLANLKFVLGDAQWLTDVFAPAEIDVLYIHFCDPWPKSRHSKRRLTHEDFLGRYRQVLSPSGVIRFKTDNRELFDYSLASFEAFGLELLTVSYDFHAGQTEGLGFMTEYEKKFSAAGLPVYYCEARFGKKSEGDGSCG